MELIKLQPVPFESFGKIKQLIGRGRFDDIRISAQTISFLEVAGFTLKKLIRRRPDFPNAAVCRIQAGRPDPKIGEFEGKNYPAGKG